MSQDPRGWIPHSSRYGRSEIMLPIVGKCSGRRVQTHFPTAYQTTNFDSRAAERTSDGGRSQTHDETRLCNSGKRRERKRCRSLIACSLSPSPFVLLSNDTLTFILHVPFSVSSLLHSAHLASLDARQSFFCRRDAFLFLFREPCSCQAERGWLRASRRLSSLQLL